MNFIIESDVVDIDKYIVSSKLKSLISNAGKSLIFDSDIHNIIESSDIGVRRLRCLHVRGINDFERIVLFCMFVFDTPVKILSKSAFMQRLNITSEKAFIFFLEHYLKMRDFSDFDTSDCFFVQSDISEEFESYIAFDSKSAFNDSNGNMLDVLFRHIIIEGLLLNVICVGDKLFPKEIIEDVTADNESIDVIPDFNKQIDLIRQSKKLYFIKRGDRGFDFALKANTNFIDVYLSKANKELRLIYDSNSNEFMYFSEISSLAEYKKRFPSIFYYGNGLQYKIRIDATLTKLSVDELEAYIKENMDSQTILTRGFVINQMTNYVTGETHKFFIVQVARRKDSYILFFNETKDKYLRYSKGTLNTFKKYEVVNEQ